MKAASRGRFARLLLLPLMFCTAGANSAPAAQPVLVELFTSEGCSSCPPADALLRRLLASQPVAGVRIIGLEEHVDYWNGLGWTDPFSAAQFTRRQYRYVAALHENAPYTPQMVVNGRRAFVGSDSGRALSVISAAGNSHLATISLAQTYSKLGKPQLHIHIGHLPQGSGDAVAEVWLAITEDDLASRVAAGENGGRRLRHDAVVRRLELVGNMDFKTADTFSAASAIRIAPGWNKRHLNAIVFVQGAKTRHILGVAMLALRPSQSQ